MSLYGIKTFAELETLANKREEDLGTYKTRLIERLSNTEVYTAGEHVAAAANDMAKSEGYVMVAQRFVRGLRRMAEEMGSPFEDIKSEMVEFLMGSMTFGGDDEWSGRGNDVRRAKFDGQREAVSDLFTWLNRWDGTL